VTTFLLGMVAGAYLLGFGFTIFALWDEPWLDRIVIAVLWPIAAVRNLLFD
jgi:hypothetical protein